MFSAQELSTVIPQLAVDPSLRSSLPLSSATFWTSFSSAWRTLVLQQDVTHIILLGRFTRNLVAENSTNQEHAYVNVPTICSLIHRYTSWSAMQDDNTFPITQALTQAVSNILTNNDALASSFWESFMQLPEDKVLLIRLLASPDAKTVLAAFVLVLNCINESQDRTKQLASAKIGARICVCILDDMVDLYDAEEESEGGRAFDVGYEIITRMITTGCIPDLYLNLHSPGEVVTPAQTTLLKLLDSYLQSRPLVNFADLPSPGSDPSRNRASPSSPSPSPQNEANRTKEELASMLIAQFFSMSVFTCQSISNGAANVDAMLPKVCEALVLVSQCIISISLGGEVTDDMRWRDLFDAAEVEGTSRMVEILVDLLRSLDAFLPRINFGKPVSANPATSLSSPPHSTLHSSAPPNTPLSVPTDDVKLSPSIASPPPNTPLTPSPYISPSPGYSTSSSSYVTEGSRPLTPNSAGDSAEFHTGQNDTTPTPESEAVGPSAHGFAYLKRDLVRLLGILIYRNKHAQDRARIAGGVEVVMNLCVIDERNPYLQEHAIFTLSRLLENNAENQALVEALKLQGKSAGS